MNSGIPTGEFLRALDLFSGGKLTRAEDLGLLIDLSKKAGTDDVLAELCFVAKFLSRTRAIMLRIGPDGEGYDKLAKEFGANMEKAQALMEVLLAGAPQNVQSRFRTTYLAMTQPAMENLMALYYDLSWYKNWLIDVDRIRE